MRSTKLSFHVLAIVIVIFWGTTFVSTKMLILAGLTPAVIFTVRFIVAYLLILFISHKKMWCDSIKDELAMAGLGITGGSLYFLAENMALEYTTATNTSLIVCSCPLFASLFCAWFAHEHQSKTQWMGTILAFIGMAVVVLNGRFVLNLNPVGDVLAFIACICWAIYSLLIKKVGHKYSSQLITRKVFAYGVLTIIPYFFFRSNEIPADFNVFLEPTVWGNLAFLSIVASFICYLLWTVCIHRLGTIEATNYVYLNPMATIVAASIVLGEVITVWFILGSSLILLGLWFSNKKSIKK
ncbi:MAG: DMT family transporter [Bacteroidales bacterium]|nr:DMT family transporter [Bacteroidales bacterium]